MMIIICFGKETHLGPMKKLFGIRYKITFCIVFVLYLNLLDVVLVWLLLYLNLLGMCQLYKIHNIMTTVYNMT